MKLCVVFGRIVDEWGAKKREYGREDKHVTINGQHQAPPRLTAYKSSLSANIWSVVVLIERMNKTKVSSYGMEIAFSIHQKYLFWCFYSSWIYIEHLSCITLSRSLSLHIPPHHWTKRSKSFLSSFFPAERANLRWNMAFERNYIISETRFHPEWELKRMRNIFLIFWHYCMAIVCFDLMWFVCWPCICCVLAEKG